jgi:hypothetical protein
MLNSTYIFTKEMSDGAHFHCLWDSFMSHLSDFLCASILTIHHATQRSPNMISPAAAHGCTSGSSSGYFTALSSFSFFCSLTNIFHLCSAGRYLLCCTHGFVFFLTSFEYLLSLSLLLVVLSLRNPLASSFLLMDARIGGVGLSLVH